MLCDNCHKRPACVHLRSVEPDGKITNRNLCASCAVDELLVSPSAANALAALRQSMESNGFELPDSIKDDLLKAAKLEKNDSAAHCPDCGAIYDDIVEKRHLGCVKCLDFFRAELRGRYADSLSSQRRTRRSHSAIPVQTAEQSMLSERLQELEAQLQLASQREEYESAAQLQQEIKLARAELLRVSQPEQSAEPPQLEEWTAELLSEEPDVYTSIYPGPMPLWIPRNPKSGSEIRLSSCVTLHRNIANTAAPPFLKSPAALPERVSSDIIKVLKRDPLFQGATEVLPEDYSSEEHEFFQAFFLIPPEVFTAKHHSRILISPNNRVVAYLNCYDHLAVSIFGEPGYSANACQILTALDKRLRKHFVFAADPEFGFISRDLSALGSGITFREFLHLRGLKIEGSFETIINACGCLGATLAPLFSGNEDEDGAIYCLSNQDAVGSLPLSQRCQQHQKIALLLERREKDARSFLQNNFQMRTIFMNRLGRIAGVIKGARLIEHDEAFFILSMLWIGHELGVFPGIDKKQLFSLYPKISSPVNPEMLPPNAGELLTKKGARNFISDTGRAILFRITFCQGEKFKW